MIARRIDIDMSEIFEQLKADVSSTLGQLLGKIRVPATGETPNGPIPDPTWVFHMIMQIKNQQLANIGQTLILTSLIEVLIEKSFISEEALEATTEVVGLKLAELEKEIKKQNTTIATPKKSRIQFPPGTF